jgi:hypothetical protein
LSHATRLDCGAYTAAIHLLATIAENIALTAGPFGKLRVEGSGRARPIASAYVRLRRDKSLRCVVGGQKHKLGKSPSVGYLATMSTVQEIEAAIPRLSRMELQQFRAWFEDYVEDHLELTDDVKAKLDESRGEIAAGNYTTRQPQ